MKKIIHHSDYEGFDNFVKELLLYRKVVSAERSEDRVTAKITLDNGVVLDVRCNEGGCICGNGDYFIDELCTCDNAITNVEYIKDYGWDSDVYKIFIFADNKKINMLQVSGQDNGYYGSGYSLNVTLSDMADAHKLSKIAAKARVYKDVWGVLLRNWKEKVVAKINNTTNTVDLEIFDSDGSHTTVLGVADMDTVDVNDLCHALDKQRIERDGIEYKDTGAEKVIPVIRKVKSFINDYCYECIKSMYIDEEHDLCANIDKSFFRDMDYDSVGICHINSDVDTNLIKEYIVQMGIACDW